jgi:hypothetical protein
MSAHDSWLDDGSEPAPWDEESAPWGLCPNCETPNEHEGRDYCPACEPRTDIIASFVVDTATGAVTEAAA